MLQEFVSTIKATSYTRRIWIFISFVLFCALVITLSIPNLRKDFLLFAQELFTGKWAFLSISVTSIVLGILMLQYLSFWEYRISSRGPHGSLRKSFKNITNVKGPDRYFEQRVMEFFVNPGKDEGEEKKSYFTKEEQVELAKMRSDFLDSHKRNLKFNPVTMVFENLQKRMEDQISRLVRSSNLNLIIGIVTTLVAVGILTYSIFTEKAFKDNWDLVAYYLLRISTVIFVEIFSFFFLRLYRNNLLEIKYFQNEITSMSYRKAALKIAIVKEDEAKLKELISTFSSVERNQILKANETTEKVATIQLDKNQASSFAQSMEKFVQTMNLNSTAKDDKS